jgi:hypothetical protein
LSAHVELENSGERRVTVLGSIYRVTGTTISESPSGPDSPLKPRNRYHSASEFKVIQSGQVILPRSQLEPTQVYSTDLAVLVPRSFTLVGLSVDLVVADAERLVLGRPRALLDPTDQERYQGAESDVIPQSWVDRLTRRKRVVRLLWSAPESPQVRAYVALPGPLQENEVEAGLGERDIDRYYRISHVVASTGTALAPSSPTPPTQR